MLRELQSLHGQWDSSRLPMLQRGAAPVTHALWPAQDSSLGIVQDDNLATLQVLQKGGSTCDTEHNASQLIPTAAAVAQEERKPVIRPKRFEDVWAVCDDVVEADDGVEDEPDQDDRRERCAHHPCTKLLC